MRKLRSIKQELSSRGVNVTVKWQNTEL